MGLLTLCTSPLILTSPFGEVLFSPQLGRVGVVPGTYEWTVTGLPYIIVHEVDDDKDQVVVIGIFHGAQDR